MTTFTNVNPDKTMGTAQVLADIHRMQKELDEKLGKQSLKEAPFKMKLNGINIISSDVIPQGTVVVSKEFADMIYTACLEQESKSPE